MLNSCWQQKIMRFIIRVLETKQGEKKQKEKIWNLTKTQAKKRIEELKERITDLKMELEELQSDLENESGDIEPYDGKDDLTPQQEEQ